MFSSDILENSVIPEYVLPYYIFIVFSPQIALYHILYYNYPLSYL